MDEESPDTWREGVGLVNQTRGCSYCGSMHPDDFMQKLRDGGYEVGPTDKSYKAYLRKLVTDEEFEVRRKALIARYVDGGMSESAAIEYVDHMASDSLRSAGDEGKFYFQHLSQEQMQEFIDMLNFNSMKIGYPGHFYRRPYFIAP